MRFMGSCEPRAKNQRKVPVLTRKRSTNSYVLYVEKRSGKNGKTNGSANNSHNTECNATEMVVAPVEMRRLLRVTLYN